MGRTLSHLFIVLLLFGATVAAQSMVDQYGALFPDDEFGRLAYFADQIKSNANATGTVVVVKDRREAMGEFLRYFYGVKAFMTGTFGISRIKINMVYGGEGIRKTELYIGTRDAADKAKPFRLNENLSGTINKKTLFDVSCIDCDSSPFINQFIFREGIDHLANALIANPRTYSEIVISRVEGLSQNAKERRTLSNEIYARLKSHGASLRSRVKLRFVNGSFARIYLIPGAKTFRRKNNAVDNASMFLRRASMQK